MSHEPRDTTGGLENSVRQSWCAGSKIKILSSTSKQWVVAHIVTIHKDWLYCLLEDGDTKKIDRWDASVQPMRTDDAGEDDEDLFWLKDDFGSTPGGDVAPGQSMSLGFNTLAKTNIGDDFSSTKITASSGLMSPRSKETAKEREFAQSKMCGYTIWVQWCDSSCLHGYYHCVGLRNNRFHFAHRRDSLAELFADDKGYWYLMYDMKCLYKSKRKGHEDPPPRNWKCIEGCLPPPGVSQVALPDDGTRMVIIEEKKKTATQTIDSDDDDDDGTSSHLSGASRQTTIKHKSRKSKSKSRKKKKDKKEKKELIGKLFQDEFEVEIDLLDFYFSGRKQVAFHLNIGRHMEVTKVKEGGQAHKLGVIQGDILFKINDDDVSKDWEGATALLRKFVSKKKEFTITFVRRKVENLMINVVRAGSAQFNGKYRFYKRDPEDDMCPIYVKNEDLDDMEMFTDEKEDGRDPLKSNSASVHIIERVYANPENSEALWVIKNGCDDHYYMCVTDEYLPPQHGWELVPESEASYPAPGLQFTSAANKFDHVNRLRGYTQSDATATTATTAAVHDALNINNRNRTNKHRHEKTLTRMRQTLGSTNEFNNAAANNKRSHTGGVSGYMPQNKAYGGGKRAGFGSKLFGAGSKKKKAAVAVAVHHTPSSGNQSASETEEDSAKLERIWKSKLEETTKKAINQLTTQHKEELKSADVRVSDLNATVDALRGNVADSSEQFYQMYLAKCELSLMVQEKQIDAARWKSKHKEMAKRLFYQQQKTEDVQSKLTQISSTFSTRMNAIQSMPKKHRPTKSTVNDLASIEAQFRTLLKTDHTTQKPQQPQLTNADSSFLESEIIELKARVTANNDQMLLIRQENAQLKREAKTAQKSAGADQFYQERSNKLSQKVSAFQQNIYNLMSLLQNIEQEYMQKCGKLPKATKSIDWRNEYDPKKYKFVAHPTNQTFVINQNDVHSIKKEKKKDKKHKKRKKEERAATQMNFNSAAVAVKPKHHGRAANESRIIDL
eukprot:88509_1